jgi:hypothetical protein
MEGADMSAVHALKLARSAGIRIGIDGDALILDADTAPPSDVLELLVLRKAQVIALLRTGRDGWSGDDWRTFFYERAGICRVRGRLASARSQARAFACCVAEWLNRNPARSPPGRCLGCGEAEHGQDPLLPFGTERTGMPGCIRSAGPHGTPAGRRKPSPPFQPLASTR